MKNIVRSLALVTFLFTTVQANYEYESCLFCEQQNLLEPIQEPKKNNFVRFMRPLLRTMEVMTSTLSLILGAATILACLDWLDRRESLTYNEKKNKVIMIAAWLVNKTLYHLSDYALEEMDNSVQH